MEDTFRSKGPVTAKARLTRRKQFHCTQKGKRVAKIDLDQTGGRGTPLQLALHRLGGGSSSVSVHLNELKKLVKRKKEGRTYDGPKILVFSDVIDQVKRAENGGRGEEERGGTEE